MFVKENLLQANVNKNHCLAFSNRHKRNTTPTRQQFITNIWIS